MVMSLILSLYASQHWDKENEKIGLVHNEHSMPLALDDIHQYQLLTFWSLLSSLGVLARV